MVIFSIRKCACSSAQLHLRLLSFRLRRKKFASNGTNEKQPYVLLLPCCYCHAVLKLEEPLKLFPSRAERAVLVKSYFREGYGEKATFLEVTSQRIVDIFSGNRFV